MHHNLDAAAVVQEAGRSSAMWVGEFWACVLAQNIAK